MAGRHGDAAGVPNEARLFGRDVQVVRTTPSPSAVALPSRPAPERILTDGASIAAPAATLAAHHAQEGIGFVWGASIFVGSMLAVLLVVGLLSLSGRLRASPRRQKIVDAKDRIDSASSSDASDAEEPPEAGVPPRAREAASPPTSAPTSAPREAAVQSPGRQSPGRQSPGRATFDLAVASPGARIVVQHQTPPRHFTRSPMGQATTPVYSPYSPEVSQVRSVLLQQGCTLDLPPAPRAAQRPAPLAVAQPQCGGPSAPDSTVTCLTPRSSGTRQTDCELGGATPVETRHEYD